MHLLRVDSAKALPAELQRVHSEAHCPVAGAELAADA